MTYKLDTDPTPRRACDACNGTMQDFGFSLCASCAYGPEFSRTSVGAGLLAARGARKRETARSAAKAGSPRRRQPLPTARELRDAGLDAYERGERRTRAEEVIRSVMLS